MAGPTLDLERIREGAPVATADGRQLGKVGNILRALPDLSPIQAGPPGVFATPAPGGYGAGETVFFKLEPNAERRHGGASGYYVPLMAVAHADDAGVRLTYRDGEVPLDEWEREPAAFPGT